MSEARLQPACYRSALQAIAVVIVWPSTPTDECGMSHYTK